MFDYSDKVGTDIVLLHSCPKSSCQILSKAFLKPIKHGKGLAGANGLLYGAPSCSEVFHFFSNDFLRLRLQCVQYDRQHDFA